MSARKVFIGQRERERGGERGRGERERERERGGERGGEGRERGRERDKK